MDLKNAAVLVTGGSCGIGFETARVLRSRGARVAICVRHADMLEAAAKQIGARVCYGVDHLGDKPYITEYYRLPADCFPLTAARYGVHKTREAGSG